MPEHLTDAIVKRLPLPDKGSKGKVIYDAGEPKGFGVRVSPGGTRSFILNYRVRGTGLERRHTIGRFPNWTTVEARNRAKELRTLIDMGGDPVGALEDERAAPTVADLTERFKAEHLPRRRASTAGDYTRMLDNHIGPALAHLKVAAVTSGNIDALHRKITKAGSPYAANRCIAVLSRMFSLAVRWNMRPDNPCKGVDKNTEYRRRRYLSADELGRLYCRACSAP
jgi:Arm DNA-binding domain